MSCNVPLGEILEVIKSSVYKLVGEVKENQQNEDLCMILSHVQLALFELQNSTMIFVNEAQMKVFLREVVKEMEINELESLLNIKKRAGVQSGQ